MDAAAASPSSSHKAEIDDDVNEGADDGNRRGFSVGDPVYIQHGDTWVEGFVLQKVENDETTLRSDSESKSEGNAGGADSGESNQGTSLGEGKDFDNESKKHSNGVCYVVCLLDKTLVPDVTAARLQLRTNLFTEDAVEEVGSFAASIVLQMCASSTIHSFCFQLESPRSSACTLKLVHNIPAFVLATTV